PEETHERRERGEPLLVVVVHLDHEIAVAHPRSVSADLDLGIGGSRLAQRAAGRLCYRLPPGRSHPSAALAPRLDPDGPPPPARAPGDAGPPADERRHPSSLPAVVAPPAGATRAQRLRQTPR